MTPGTAEHVYALEQRIQALERTVADTAELLQIAVGEIETRDAKVAELVGALEMVDREGYVHDYAPGANSDADREIVRAAIAKARGVK